jgi:hypothetical protein
VDCLGAPNGTALPGTPCDDSDPGTGNDTWGADCSCTGSLIDCFGVPGGGAIIDACGVCGGTNACIDSTVCYTVGNIGDPDAEEAANGLMYLNTGGLDLSLDSEPGSPRGQQLVGLRFQGVQVPNAADVITASIQFMMLIASMDFMHTKAAGTLHFRLFAQVEPIFPSCLFDQIPIRRTLPWAGQIDGLCDSAFFIFMLDKQTSTELLCQVANHAFY